MQLFCFIFLFLFLLSLEYRTMALVCGHRALRLHWWHAHKKPYKSCSLVTVCPAPQQSSASKFLTLDHGWIWYGEGELCYQPVIRQNGKRITAAPSSLWVEDSHEYISHEKLISYLLKQFYQQWKARTSFIRRSEFINWTKGDFRSLASTIRSLWACPASF